MKNGSLRPATDAEFAQDWNPLRVYWRIGPDLDAGGARAMQGVPDGLSDQTKIRIEHVYTYAKEDRWVVRRPDGVRCGAFNTAAAARRWAAELNKEKK